MGRDGPASERLRRRVTEYVRDQQVLRPGEHVLLLLSGGADSMALLDLLARVDRRLGLGLTFAALHIDYAARGADSDRDRDIVAAACATAGVRLHEVRLPRKLQGGDFQARARALRYDHARALAAAEGYDAAATAHNRDDQAETVLYRLAKYATPRGLAGMRPRGTFVARPLLCLGAGEIRSYCRELGIPYGEDVTNALPVYARNRVRLEVLPALARINPRVTETLAAGAELAAAQDEVLQAAAAAAIARVTAPPPPGELAAVDLARFAAEPAAVRSLVLHELARAALGGDALVERRALAALLRLAERPDETGRAALRGGLEAVRGEGLLRLRRRAVPHRCEPVALEVAEVAAAGHDGLAVAVCGRRFRVRREAARRPAGRERAGGVGAQADGLAPAPPRRPEPSERPGDAFVALPPAARRLTLRHPRRGDAFAPLGLGARTTVARFLAAARVSPAARSFSLVADVDGAVAWVGYWSRSGAWRGRVAEPFRVQESTASLLHVFEEGS